MKPLAWQPVVRDALRRYDPLAQRAELRKPVDPVVVAAVGAVEVSITIVSGILHTSSPPRRPPRPADRGTPRSEAFSAAARATVVLSTAPRRA
jgi:hypothetical protein